MNLQQIFERANVLCNNNFATVASIVGHLNAAQDIIARYDPIRAEPYVTMVTDEGVMLPADLLKVHRLYVVPEGSAPIPYQTSEQEWGGLLPTPDLVEGTVLKVLYYVKPPELTAVATYAEPRVPRQYHESMAQYAAKMFYLSDDDPGLRDSFNAEFLNGLSFLKAPVNTVTKFSNFM